MCDDNTDTPLHVAASNGSTEVACYLIEELGSISHLEVNFVDLCCIMHAREVVSV